MFSRIRGNRIVKVFEHKEGIELCGNSQCSLWNETGNCFHGSSVPWWCDLEWIPYGLLKVLHEVEV